jgi:hypothetical protein
MKIFTQGFLCASCLISIAVQAADTNPPPRLTVDLRDGSRVVGTSVENNFKFHSALLGDIKLAVKDIRGVECVSSNSAKLTTVNDDTLTVSFVDPDFAVQTSFGKVELPVDAVRQLSVSTIVLTGIHPPGLVALWSGEGNANDSVGGNNGSSTIGIDYADGVVGQAFKFDGSRVDGVGYIPVPASPCLNVGAGSGLTIECWIKPAHLGPIGAEGIPIVEWDSQSKEGLGFWVEQGFKLYGNIEDSMGNSHTLMSARGLVSTRRFQHVALTYDKNTGAAMLYINGIVAAAENIGSLTPQTAWPLNIGRRTGQPIGRNNTYSGLLDELALYNRALSANEIKSICILDNHGEMPPPPVNPLMPMNGIYHNGFNQ